MSARLYQCRETRAEVRGADAILAVAKATYIVCAQLLTGEVGEILRLLDGPGVRDAGMDEDDVFWVRLCVCRLRLALRLDLMDERQANKPVNDLTGIGRLEDLHQSRVGALLSS